MRVDPMMQMNEAITSVLEVIAYPSIVVLAVAALIVGAVELRSKVRRPVARREGSDRLATAAR